MGHDFLAQQGAPAALDTVDRRVDLVGAVDGQVEPAIGPLGDRDPACLGLGTALQRGDDRLHREAASHPPGQPLDEVAGCAACPQPDDGAGPDKLEGARGGGLLLCLDFRRCVCHLRDITAVR